MKNVSIVILLVVNLLTCSLRCMSCDWQLPCDNKVVSHGCSCCETKNQIPPPYDPVPQKQDCGCTSCLCDGALISSSETTPRVDAIMAWLPPAHLRLVDKMHLVEPHDVDVFGPLGRFLTGRDARIAHQSWQI